MGWSCGSELADEVWRLVLRYIPSKRKQEIASEIIDMFEAYDADTFEKQDRLCKDAKRYQEEEKA